MGVDHLFLADLCLLHSMDLVTKYSTVHNVSTTALNEAVIGFEASWM